MVDLFRKSVGFVVAAPFFLSVKALSLVVGRQRAIEILGPFVTAVVRIMAEASLIPSIQSPDEFELFVEKMKRNIRKLRLLYDVSIE